MTQSSKVALITGASSGIGAAAAVALGARGYAVGINYFEREAPARQTARQVEQVGGRALLCPGDVSVRADARRMVEQTVAAFGGLDALVNNAGTPVARSSLADLDEAVWDRCVEINLKGVFLVSQAAMPHLRARRGAIVHVSSAATRTGGAGSAHYAAAKAGVESLTRSMARELAPDVIVNCLAPGFIDTPFHEKFSSDEHRARSIASTLLKRAGSAEEMAAWIAFLVEAPYATGQVFHANGGMAL